MSISLNITADNYNELKTKAFEALGLTSPVQQALPFQTVGLPTGTDISAQTGSQNSVQQGVESVEAKTKSAPLAGLVDKQKTPRTRRTKAEIEAERKAKNVGANPADTIQNNFEASDEIEDINASTVSTLSNEVETSDEDAAPTKTFEDCKTILKQVLKNPGGEGTKAAMKLFAKFGIGKLVDIDPSKFGEFYALAEKELK